VLTCSNIYLIN